MTAAVALPGTMEEATATNNSGSLLWFRFFHMRVCVKIGI